MKWGKTGAKREERKRRVSGGSGTKSEGRRGAGEGERRQERGGKRHFHS